MNAPKSATAKFRKWVVRCVVLWLGVGVGVWLHRTNSPRAEFHTGGSVEALVFAPDGTRLATATTRFNWTSGQPEGMITVWDIATQQPQKNWVAHGRGIASLAFSTDGATLTSVALPFQHDAPHTQAKTWDIATGQQVGDTRHVPSVANFPVRSPDGRVRARHGGAGILVIEDATGKELYRVEADPQQLNCAAFAPDGQTLASGSGSTAGGGPSPWPGTNGRLCLWDAPTAQLLVQRRWHIEAPIVAVAFAPNGKLVATGNVDGTVQLWDVPAR